MTKQELYYKLTGTENPRFITEREEIIITKCLDLINERDEALNMRSVSRSNKENEDPIIGSITEVAYTVRDNHGFLKIQIPYGYYKIEKWKNGDKVELVITR